MDDDCCAEAPAVEVQLNSTCGEDKCCSQTVKSTPDDNEDDDSENKPQHTQAHQCNSCAITFIIDIPIILEQLVNPFASSVNTEVKELLSRYSFSIWNPPNVVV